MWKLIPQLVLIAASVAVGQEAPLANDTPTDGEITGLFDSLEHPLDSVRARAEDDLVRHLPLAKHRLLSVLASDPRTPAEALRYRSTVTVLARGFESVRADLEQSYPSPNLQLRLGTVDVAGTASLREDDAIGPTRLLLTFFEDSDPRVRALAVRYAGLTGSREVVGPLVLHLRDPDREVRVASAQSLAYVGVAAESALPALAEASRSAGRLESAELLSALADLGEKLRRSGRSPTIRTVLWVFARELACSAVVALLLLALLLRHTTRATHQSLVVGVGASLPMVGVLVYAFRQQWASPFVSLAPALVWCLIAVSLTTVIPLVILRVRRHTETAARSEQGESRRSW